VTYALSPFTNFEACKNQPFTRGCPPNRPAAKVEICRAEVETGEAITRRMDPASLQQDVKTALKGTDTEPIIRPYPRIFADWSWRRAAV